MVQTYPISLMLADAAVLVVGGGEVATRKIKGLLECGAQVLVVSPEITPELKHLIDQGLCQWKKRVYESSDLLGVLLVFVCTNNEKVNVRVSQEAAEQHLLVNVADVPELCSFYLPSVLRRGMLSIAVSTEGSSPLTARRIREYLDEQLGDEIEEYLALLQSWRKKVTTTMPSEKRQLFWQRASDGLLYELVRKNCMAEAEEMLEALYREIMV